MSYFASLSYLEWNFVWDYPNLCMCFDINLLVTNINIPQGTKVFRSRWLHLNATELNVQSSFLTNVCALILFQHRQYLYDSESLFMLFLMVQCCIYVFCGWCFSLSIVWCMSCFWIVSFQIRIFCHLTTLQNAPQSRPVPNLFEKNIKYICIINVIYIVV